jgi:hypothetical protein
MIKKRYIHLTEEILKENPNIYTYEEPSLDARQDMLVKEVPKLGEKAASKAIKEWGRPKSEITHLIFCSTSGVDMPGADYQLIKLLNLNPSTVAEPPPGMPGHVPGLRYCFFFVLIFSDASSSFKFQMFRLLPFASYGFFRCKLWFFG